MEWLESDFKKINQQNRSLFLNKIKSNLSSSNFNCYLFNESGNLNQDLFFITDLKVRLKVKINPKRIFLIRKFYDNKTDDVLLVNVFIKQFLYSTMINFRNSKEPFIFMIINDFDLKSNENKYAMLPEIQHLVRWDHLKNANTQLPKLDYILKTSANLGWWNKRLYLKSGISRSVNELSLHQLSKFAKLCKSNSTGKLKFFLASESSAEDKSISEIKN
ncbi:hypothetical protein BpHYR1_005700 [Brachionus plicatilis]|uniref:Uncharacterized protein n=1 Tax=Brachionus plicatilis TaxID=10195 RepID=A0A3M7QVF4_BRAPC|nr:hypothetical protein BpHYR1_005700 [Brachionus plicatilis]